MTQRLEDLPARERVHVEGGWRIALAFNSSLPGWLVLIPMRHVTAFHDLTRVESEEFGLLARRASIALQQVTGCEKTYLMLFAEAEGFDHLHVHLVPRMPDQPEQVRGPRVFGHLEEDRDRWLPEAEQDALAVELRSALGRAR